MEKQKEVRRVSLFSSEGKTTVSQIVQVEEEKVQLLPELAPDGEKNEGEQTRKLPGDLLHCSACDVSFTDRQEQIEHYKLDWHRHNLKRRLRGLPSSSQDQFESQSGTGDLSSISGSDTDSNKDEEDDEVGGVNEGAVHRIYGSPFIVFMTPDGIHHAVYKSLVMATKDSRSTLPLSDLSQPLSNLTSIGKPWVILMRSGGHFAGAVFKGSTVICHKTFHRYTVRAKQGTVQSSRDSNHGAHKPRSAGASLRRYNEAALEQEISDLLYSWKKYIDDALLIMVRSPKNRRVMFGSSSGKETLISSDDPRVRGIPFMTRRPTFSEIKSVWLKLTTVYSGVHIPQAQQPQTHSIPNAAGSKPHATKDKMADTELYMDKVTDWLKESNGSSTDNDNEQVREKKQKKKKRKNKLSPSSSAVQREEDDVDPVIKKLHELIINGDEGGVEQLLIVNETGTIDQGCQSSTHHVDVNEQFKGNSALHVAAACGHGNIVYTLLSHGANPSIKDNNTNGVPYLVCKDRLTRDQFRRFMAHNPTAFDYTMSLIPGPLTDEMEDSRREKRNERKKAQKKAQKQKKKAKASEEELMRLEKQRDTTMKGLSEREKRAMAAEKRMAESTSTPTANITMYGACSLCGSSLCGVVAFERLNYRYCSIECVRKHREQLQHNMKS